MSSLSFRDMGVMVCCACASLIPRPRGVSNQVTTLYKPQEHGLASSSFYEVSHPAVGAGLSKSEPQFLVPYSRPFSIAPAIRCDAVSAQFTANTGVPPGLGV